MTGSGKTAAFLLPIMHHLLQNRPAGNAPRATRVLILTPTRELAAQIRAHAAELGFFTPLTSAAVFGGVGMGPQEAAFRSGVDIMVACPGRLLDHFTYPHGKLPHLDHLVIDEADRMLDMGFLPDIRRVLRHLPTTSRQTLFFSATMPEPIVQLSREMLKNPVAINIDRESKPAEGITQTAFPVPETRKTALLLEILQRETVRNAIVFTRTKHRADRLAKVLAKNGINCAALHGNRSQNQRTQAMDGFKGGKIQILVATDIAARGIDVEALSHVINYDVPHISDDYIHRVGRTARASRVGEAYTFVTPADETDFRQIERRSDEKIVRRRLEGFDYSAPAGETLEIPLGERIAAIRARKAEERARHAAKVAARAAREGGQTGTAAARGTAARPLPARGSYGAGSRPSAGSSPSHGQRSVAGHPSTRSQSAGSSRPAGRTPESRHTPERASDHRPSSSPQEPRPSRSESLEQPPMRRESRQVGQPCAPLGSSSTSRNDRGRSGQRPSQHGQGNRRSGGQGRGKSVPMFD